jgi:hypothetical protein
MRETIWHKNPETGKYTLIKQSFWGTVTGLAIADIFHDRGRYHFATSQQTLSSIGDIASTLLAVAIGATTVVVIALAFRMAKDRRRTRLARD